MRGVNLPPPGEKAVQHSRHHVVVDRHARPFQAPRIRVALVYSWVEFGGDYQRRRDAMHPGRK